MKGRAVFLALLLLLGPPLFGPASSRPPAAALAQDPEGAIKGTRDAGALYADVTRTHLPPKGLPGFSMDAAPVDVDGDGDLDLVLAHEFRPNILLINDGRGRFADESAHRLPQVAHDSEDVGIGDLDRDGDPDIVVVSEDDQVNEVYLNDGRGFFSDGGHLLPVTGISNAVTVADLDMDGDLDIFIGNNGQNVILINSSGAFLNETDRRLPAAADITQDADPGDVDGDGDLDLLLGNEDGNRLLLNDGRGFFADAPRARLPLGPASEETREADFGDVDGDGDLDIVFANVRLFVPQALARNRLLINDGRGFFTDETAGRLPEDTDNTFDADFVDLDRDGDLDIVTANLDDVTGRRFAAPYRVYLNDGKGAFKEGTGAVLPPGITGNGLDIEAADFNGDGLIDLYLASRGGPDRLLLGLEAGRRD